MANLRVRVENGKVVGDAPPGFEDGAELDVVAAELVRGKALSGALVMLDVALEELGQAVLHGVKLSQPLTKSPSLR